MKTRKLIIQKKTKTTPLFSNVEINSILTVNKYETVATFFN